MSELIRREDLENWLRTECYGTDTYDDKEYVIGRMRKELPTITAPRWHRVEEPPKKTGKYAACWIYQEKIYWDWLIFIDGNWFSQAGLPLPDSGLPLPDYWMPIEPPKEVQE